jgi:hypothetical protein
MYQSYLVRVWFEDDEQQSAGWQAEIQQIQSGDSWSFSNRQELLDCLTQLLSEPDESGAKKRHQE